MDFQLVKAEKAATVETSIVSMALKGKLPGVVTEGKLIEMLEGIAAVGQGRGGGTGGSKINFQRKKYAFASDEDDNDDDLL